MTSLNMISRATTPSNRRASTSHPDRVKPNEKVKIVRSTQSIFDNAESCRTAGQTHDLQDPLGLLAHISRAYRSSISKGQGVISLHVANAVSYPKGKLQNYQGLSRFPLPTSLLLFFLPFNPSGALFREHADHLVRHELVRKCSTILVQLVNCSVEKAFHFSHKGVLRPSNATQQEGQVQWNRDMPNVGLKGFAPFLRGLLEDAPPALGFHPTTIFTPAEVETELVKEAAYNMKDMLGMLNISRGLPVIGAKTGSR